MKIVRIYRTVFGLMIHIFCYLKLITDLVINTHNHKKTNNRTKKTINIRQSLIDSLKRSFSK